MNELVARNYSNGLIHEDQKPDENDGFARLRFACPAVLLLLFAPAI